MRALRVAGGLEVRGLCGALDGTPIRVRLHRQLPAGRVPDILGDDRHTAQLYCSTSPCRSSVGHQSSRSSCNCETPSCNVAIQAFHDSRTDTIACFILNRCSVFPQHRKRRCLRHSLVSCAPARCPVKYRRSLKTIYFGASPRRAGPAGGFFSGQDFGGKKTSHRGRYLKSNTGKNRFLASESYEPEHPQTPTRLEALLQHR